MLSPTVSYTRSITHRRLKNGMHPALLPFKWLFFTTYIQTDRQSTDKSWWGCSMSHNVYANSLATYKIDPITQCRLRFSDTWIYVHSMQAIISSRIWACVNAPVFSFHISTNFLPKSSSQSHRCPQRQRVPPCTWTRPLQMYEDNIAYTSRDSPIYHIFTEIQLYLHWTITTCWQRRIHQKSPKRAMWLNTQAYPHKNRAHKSFSAYCFCRNITQSTHNHFPCLTHKKAGGRICLHASPYTRNPIYVQFPLVKHKKENAFISTYLHVHTMHV